MSKEFVMTESQKWMIKVLLTSLRHASRRHDETACKHIRRNLRKLGHHGGLR